MRVQVSPQVPANITELQLMEICSFILSLVIVGAYETRPGIMYVEFLENDTVHDAYVYTEDYLSCWENGVPVQLPRDTNSGGASTPSDS